MFHQISRKHLDRYVSGFVGRHNIRGADMLDQMAVIGEGVGWKEAALPSLISC